MRATFKSEQDLSALENFYKQVKQLEKQEVNYGYFDERHYSGLNMATLAAIHEQGWNGLPARDFIYSTQINFTKDLQRLTKRLFRDIVNGIGPQNGLEAIGKAGAKKIKYTIDTGTFSNNKVSAKWAETKGFADALIHYGDLRNAATFKVSKRMK